MIDRPKTSGPRRAEILRDASPIAAAFFVNGALFGAWASRIPTIKTTFDLTPSALGLLLLMLAGGAVIAFPLAGRAADRFGAARVTRIVAVLYIAAFLGIGLAPTVAVLVAALFLFGAMHGGMDVTMNAWGAALERSRRLVALPALHATFSLGAGAGAASGYFALEQGLSLANHVFLVCAVMLLLSFIPGGTATPVSARKGRERQPVFDLPKGPLLIVGFVAFSITLGEGAMADWSAVFLVEQTGAEKSHAALGYTVFSIAMVTMRLSGGFLLRTVDHQIVVFASGALAAFGALLAALIPDYTLALIGFALMGFGFALIMPMSMSAAARINEGSSGRAIAGVATLGYGGLLLGPPIVGFVADFAGYAVAFGLVGVLALTACLGSRSYRVGH